VREIVIEYLNVCFIRKAKEGGVVATGFVADYPTSLSIPYVDPFIVVRIDASTIPEGVEKNKTVQLKLDKLRSMEEYQDVPKTRVGEDGKTVNYVDYGYFSEDCRSSEPYPVIDMEDVTYD